MRCAIFSISSYHSNRIIHFTSITTRSCKQKGNNNCLYHPPSGITWPCSVQLGSVHLALTVKVTYPSLLIHLRQTLNADRIAEIIASTNSLYTRIQRLPSSPPSFSFNHPPAFISPIWHRRLLSRYYLASTWERERERSPGSIADDDNELRFTEHDHVFPTHTRTTTGVIRISISVFTSYYFILLVFFFERRERNRNQKTTPCTQYCWRHFELRCKVLAEFPP